MDELMQNATQEQLRAALVEALIIIEQLSATAGAYIREDIVEKIKATHLNSIAEKLGQEAQA
jgi:hypothetical protein